MAYKTRTLFISIALSFLIGFIAQITLITSKAGEIPFGTHVETVFSYDYILNWEETSSESGISPETNVNNALRHFSQSKRSTHSSSSRYVLAFIKSKRNHILYTSTLDIKSTRRFPSGLDEARKRLISLGKLII